MNVQQKPESANNQEVRVKPSWIDKINAYEQLMRLDKPIGMLLLLWPTLIGLWVAGYRRPEGLLVLMFVIGTILMRSAGCVINDWWDKGFDGQVWRTKDRPLVTGLVQPNEALILALGLLLLAFLIVVKLDNLVIYALSFVSLVITIAYPLMKRWIHAPQAVLGIAFSLGIPMAFVAQLDKIPDIMVWLIGLNFLYVVAYDTSYAMADRLDDKRMNLKSTAIWFGKADVYLVLGLYTVYGIAMIYIFAEHAWHRFIFWQCLALLIFLVDQWLLLRYRDPKQCFKAFRHSHWLSAIFWLTLLKWPLVSFYLL